MRMFEGTRLTRLAWLAIVTGLGLIMAQALAQTAAPQERVVRVADLTGPIGPATTAYIERALDLAISDNAEALIIEMDTPGGLDTAMRDINQAILASPTPVIVYVHPGGSRAASAGAYILYASHLSAMAPGTSIGAATPVQMGGSPSTPQPDTPTPEAEPETAPSETDSAPPEAVPAEAAETARAPDNAQAMRNKVVNDAVAYIRSLAQLRGRNGEWAERAVRESISATASEALALSVIEIEARDFQDLLAQADGRSVTLAGGATRTLALAEAAISRVEKTWAEEALSVITNPNIAFLLLNLGFIGLLASFYNGLEPVTAIAGVICLLVGFYALNTLPVNYAGAALIVLGLALLISEAFFASSGLLALSGIAAFVLGALMVMDTPSPEFRLDWRLILASAAVLGGVSFALVSYGLASQARKVTTGARGLVGMRGRVLSWSDGAGFVQVDGERWQARSSAALSEGDEIVVVKVIGLTLKVKAAR